MDSKFEKKQAYEFCEIRRTMVRLDVIQATVRMPDRVEAELRLVPISCNRAEDCKRERLRCKVIDPDGQDPCPEAWE